VVVNTDYVLLEKHVCSPLAHASLVLLEAPVAICPKSRETSPEVSAICNSLDGSGGIVSVSMGA
jgi:hypothetical protein